MSGEKKAHSLKTVCRASRTSSLVKHCLLISTISGPQAFGKQLWWRCVNSIELLQWNRILKVRTGNSLCTKSDISWNKHLWVQPCHRKCQIFIIRRERFRNREKQSSSLSLPSAFTHKSWFILAINYNICKITYIYDCLTCKNLFGMEFVDVLRN